MPFDYSLFQLCECSAAVANALPMVQKAACFSMQGTDGAGVVELVEGLLDDDLRTADTTLVRHHLLIGREAGDAGHRPVKIPPYGTVALLVGPSGSGKSTATTGLLERLAASHYQYLVIDPEGDYDAVDDALVLGDAHHAPSAEEVLQSLRQPEQNVVANLMRVPFDERPAYTVGLLAGVQKLRTDTGRPHWLVFDEAHHLFPAAGHAAAASLPQHLETALLITVHADQLSEVVRRQVNLLWVVGPTPRQAVQEYLDREGLGLMNSLPPTLSFGQAALCRQNGNQLSSIVMTVEPSQTERRRHVRKYAEGLLIPERSFYFRGPEGKLNLRAHNLILFLELAQGVDDGTWLYHLDRGDYSRWFADVIGDHDLASEAQDVERSQPRSPDASRRRICAAVQRCNALPENPTLPKLAVDGPLAHAGSRAIAPSSSGPRS